jgi:hypothetical protein
MAMVPFEQGRTGTRQPAFEEICTFGKTCCPSPPAFIRYQLSSQITVAVTTPVPSEAIGLIQEFEGCERFEPVDGLIHA